jgi:hypothetical protein
MIEESLLKSNFIGKDGFVWWIGQVADPKVWRTEKSRVDAEDKNNSWAYRCKVRIIGYHTFNGDILPDSDLPWAHVLSSAAEGSPGQGGFGKLPMLVGGESVMGFFLDGEEAQQPVIVGCFYRNTSVQNLITPDLIQKEKSSQFKPFTGMQGNLKNGATRQKAQETGTTKQVETDASNNTQNNAGASYPGNKKVTDQLFADDAATNNFLKKFGDAGPVQGSNGCGNNILAQITAALQSFIGFVNGLERTALGFIDPIRNKVVDISQSIRKVARLIASIMKFVINSMRDMIIKLVATFFRNLIALVIPKPQQLPISEAAKKILDIIFCLFEKLFGSLFDFLLGLLGGLVGKTPNIPRCASEELSGALIAKLASLIDDALATVMSGLDWLAGGISSIASSLRGAVNILNQLLSFLSCDSLECRGITEYDPFGGIKFPSTDSWANAVGSIDILNGYGGNIDDTINLLSMFGSPQTPFVECRKKAVNPQTQDDLGVIPLGTRFYKCIPPEIVISGDGIGARATAVVNPSDGSILTVRIDDAGSGYTYPPKISIVDKSNYGAGAQATSTIDSNGRISSVYLTSAGSGYCSTNLTTIAGTSTTSTGITTNGAVGLGTTVVGVSTVPAGIVTSIVVDKPGIGYTSGDTISVGSCVYSPILTDRGSIVGITSSGYCENLFTSVPPVTINTSTGEGAELYPVIQYVPQYVVDNADLLAGITTDKIINVVQCVTNR